MKRSLRSFPHRVSKRQQQTRDVKLLAEIAERCGEEVLTDEERKELRAYADYENSAFDRATDR